MNSYPIELLAQLAPVMFIAGLESAPSASIEQSGSPQDVFASLSARLREALLSQRKVVIWQPEKSKTFRVVLVDKDVKFPPRKLVSQDDPQYSIAHSPLSPLTPSSPLYPDGLIAPIWIRKHTTLLPSVFVLFLRLFELPPLSSRSPLDIPDREREKEREQEERRKDAELCAEVASRKKGTSERGIKLTVVLMASRKMLDDPSLDSRLTYIRRQSGLDPRASLFVLSPVSSAELSDFVESLQQALYEPAIDYYIAHSKRVRRKRNRHSQASSHAPPPLSPSGGGMGTVAPRPLRPEGWTVRYEYKMACFAEFRSEDEVALKHYQDAYAMLLTMCGSTAVLPPRTKRWAEAKVLADCISIKICKLYLYNNEHSLALSQHSMHTRRFTEFSRGWGIGEETFEFWSWMARQHRVFAELLEHGTKSGVLVIPDHTPQLSSYGQQQRAKVSGPGVTTGDNDNAMVASLGLNPYHALQHPGFYYFMAARCSEFRRERFLNMEAESTQQSSLSPGYANEKKVEHLAIILELYTRAYELFKKYSPAPSQTETQSQGRLTLFVACKIAGTYYDSGKFDTAIRFLERIAKTYRREKWTLLLRPLLTKWYECARRLNDSEMSVKLLVEMLAAGTGVDGEDPGTLVANLLTLFRSTTSSSEEPLIIDLSDSLPIFDSQVMFWKSEVDVGELAAFQLSLTSPSHVSLADLPFTSLLIEFVDDVESIVVRHTDMYSTSSMSPVRRIDLGVAKSVVGGVSAPREVQAYIRWQRQSTVVFTGMVASDTPTILKISRVAISLQESRWHVIIPLVPSATSRYESASPPLWMSSEHPLRCIPVRRDHYSSATVRHRQHRLRVLLSHQAPAYLNEEYPILIDITNEDDRELDIVIDALLQPTEIDDAVNSIMLDNEHSSGLIKGVSLGAIMPGGNVVKTLSLLGMGAGGDRTIDISIQSRPLTAVAMPPSDDSNIENTTADMTETLRTLVVPIVAPITVAYDVSYRSMPNKPVGVADLRTYDSNQSDCWEAVVLARFECVGPWGLKMESFTLTRQDNDECRIAESSLTSQISDILADEYIQGDEFSDVCRIIVHANEERNLNEDPLFGPGMYEITWHRIDSDGVRGSTSVTRLPLPILSPPLVPNPSTFPGDDEELANAKNIGVLALLHVPPMAYLHEPFMLRLEVRNRHPTRTADIVVQLDTVDVGSGSGCIVAGPKSARVGVMLPGVQECVLWRVVPLECGWVKVPKVKVVDKRKGPRVSGDAGSAEGGETGDEQVVKVVEAKWERRMAESDQKVHGEEVEESLKTLVSESDHVSTILVLPR